MMLVMFSIIWIYYILSDLVLIYNSKQRKVFWIYLTMMSFAYCIYLLVATGINMPSPSTYIKEAVTAVFGL